MRNTLKRLATLTAGYSLVTLLGPLFTIILTPLYTRALSPSDYGVVDVAIASSSFINIIVILGLDQALSSHFFDGDQNYQRNLVTNALIQVVGIGLFIGAAIVIFALPLADLLYKDTGRAFIIYLLAINCVSAPTYTLVSAALRLQMNIRRVNMLGLTFLFATLTSNVVLVLVFQFKATGIIAANVIANTVAAIVALALANRSLHGKFEGALLNTLRRTGIGLLPGAFSYLLLAGADRILLTQFVPQSEIGLYAIANKLASILYVLLSTVWNAWWPLALEMGKHPDAPRQFARVLEYIFGLAIFLAISLGIFSPEILMIFTRDVYVPASSYALVLMVYYGPLCFVASFFTIGLYVQKQTYWLSVMYIAAGISNVLFNFVLDPWLGVWGAVWATLLAGILLVGFAFVVGQRTMPVPYRFGRLTILASEYVVFIYGFLVLSNMTLVTKFLGLIVFALTISIGLFTSTQLKLGLAAIRYHLQRITRVAR